MKINKTLNLDFDYIIIGSGVAGLQLALAICKAPELAHKRIAIIDDSHKTENDKTFCFWEKGKGNWDTIISKQWNHTYFYSATNKKLDINLYPYSYKKIKALDFYTYCLDILKSKTQFTFHHEKVESNAENPDSVTVKTKNNLFKCHHVFDSRLPTDFYKKQHSFAYVDQSFSGFEIETEHEAFDPDHFTMMDYRFTWHGTTSFMYTLPESKTKALVEYTFFAPFSLSKTDFETQLTTYLNTFLKGKSYQIKTKEVGVIPMTNYPFEKNNSLRITKIGTAGGWIKASTGYSFKRSEKFVDAIINQLIQNKPITGYTPPIRFKFYDRLLLNILQHQNKKGPDIFYKMYKNTNPTIFFKFLDEETTFSEEVKLISKLPYFPFIKALFQ